jgi:hypothetical protein
MNDENTEQPSPTINPQANQTHPTTPTPPGKSSPKKLLIITSVIFGFSLFGIGGFILGTKLTAPKVAAPTEPPTSDLQPSPSITATSQKSGKSLPSGWAYKPSQQQPNANDCVTIALPPIEVPYTHPDDGEIKQLPVTQDKGSGRFWHLGGGTYPNLLSKLTPPDEQYKQSMAVYATETEASGYISQAVSINCIPNSENLTNQSMLTSLKAKLQEYNKDTGEKGMEANTYTISSSKETNRWELPVLDLTVSEYFNYGNTNIVQYTMFATPKYIYEIKVFGGSEDSFVKQTAQQIADNLKFE